MISNILITLYRKITSSSTTEQTQGDTDHHTCILLFTTPFISLSCFQIRSNQFIATEALDKIKEFHENKRYSEKKWVYTRLRRKYYNITRGNLQCFSVLVKVTANFVRCVQLKINTRPWRVLGELKSLEWGVFFEGLSPQPQTALVLKAYSIKSLRNIL